MRQRVAHGLAEAHAATAVTLNSPLRFARLVQRAVVGRRNQRSFVDAQPLEAVRHANCAQGVLLHRQRKRIHHHVPREEGLHPGDQRPRSELREGVVP